MGETMMRFITRTTVLCLLLVTATAPGVRAIQDPNETDSLWVDSATAFVTGIGIVPISFYNDEHLSAIEVTLRHEPTQITVDSFSFAGGRVDSDAYTNEAAIHNDSTMIAIISLSFSQSIPPGRGLLGKLYYSYSQTISPQLVPLDTTTWFDGPIRHTTSFHEVGSLEPDGFLPYVKTGYLHLLESPESFDSVWVDRVEGAPSEPVAVDIYAYNERALAKLAVALDYGSSEELRFDSVSFVGTRCENAPSRTVQPQTSIHKLYTVVEFSEASPLATGLGPIATLHFTVDESTPEGIIEIDSTTVGIISNTRFTLTETDGSINFVPLFTRGYVEVKVPTEVEDITDGPNLPADYSLCQNYPNPFNPSTNIEFSLPEAGHVRVEVYNILGRKVRRLIDRNMPAGIHRVVFDGRSDRGALLSTGVYFYRMTAAGYQNSRKMLLLK